MTPQKKISVFGSLTVDLFVQPSASEIITRTTEESSESLFALPHGGKVSASHIQEHFGGGSANVGISFARLGNAVSVFGGRGDDANGEKIVQNLSAEKISLSNIQKFSETKSGFSLILNSFDGERTVIFTSEANQKFETIDSKKFDVENSDAVYLCHLSGKNPQKILTTLENFLTKNPEKKLFWNPGKERITKGIEKNKNLLKHCDILFLNTEEAEIFSGIRSRSKISHGSELRNRHSLTDQKKNITSEKIPDYVKDVSDLAQKFLDAGVHVVVITDGRKGAQSFSRNTSPGDENYHFFPCVPGKRIDTLGAGDSFASVFSHFYLQGEPLQQCGKYASVNAASVVSYQGAQDGLLSHTNITQK